MQPTDVQTSEAREKAQAYALRIWEGQSISLDRVTRVRYVTEGVEAQGMSMEGVELP